MFNVQCSLTRRMTIWSFMKLTFEPERIWILTLIILKSPLVIRRMSGLCLTKSNRGATTSWILENIFIGSDFIITHDASLSRNDKYWLWQELRYAMSILLILMTYLDLSMSCLGFLLCQMIFFITEREDFYPLGTLSRMEITTNVSVTKLEVFVCFFPLQFAFFCNLLKVCLLFWDPFFSRRIWYFYNNNREHLSPLCKHIWASW